MTGGAARRRTMMSSFGAQIPPRIDATWARAGARKRGGATALLAAAATTTTATKTTTATTTGFDSWRMDGLRLLTQTKRVF